MHSFFVYTRKQTKREHTSVPSGRWQSCPVQEIWPPFAAVGTMPPVSPSLSPPKSFPHQPAGTEGKTERRDVCQDGRGVLSWCYPGEAGLTRTDTDRFTGFG